MAHLHCTLPDPRGLQSSAVPAKVITEVISMYRRQLIAWLEVSTVLTNTGPLCHLGYASQHGAAAAARGV